jgi:hypothetical protein
MIDDMLQQNWSTLHNPLIGLYRKDSAGGSTELDSERPRSRKLSYCATLPSCTVQTVTVSSPRSRPFSRLAFEFFQIHS